MAHWKQEATWLAWIEYHYLQRVIDKMQEILQDTQLADLDLTTREHRYYLGAVLTSVGELSNDMLFMSCCQGDDDFKLLKTLRNNMLHDHKAMNEVSEAMQQDLYVLIELLRKGLLKKVVSINGTPERLASVESSSFSIISYHGVVKRFINDTNYYLDRYLAENNVNCNAQSTDNKQQAMFDCKSKIAGIFPGRKKKGGLENNPIKKIEDLQAEIRKIGKIKRGVEFSINAVNKYYRNHDRPEMYISTIGEISHEKINALENDLSNDTMHVVVAFRNYIETMENINTMLAEVGIEERLDMDRLYLEDDETIENINVKLTEVAIQERLKMDRLRLNDVDKDSIMEQPTQHCNLDRSPESDLTYAFLPVSVVDKLEYVREEIQYLIDQTANKEIDNQCLYIAIFCQQKIGQCFREIEEKIQLLDAPLLNDSIRETIRTRNKGIAHEILAFSRIDLFNHIRGHTEILRESIPLVLSLYTVTQEGQNTHIADNPEQFTLEQNDIAKKYRYLGLVDKACEHVRGTLVKIQAYEQCILSDERNVIEKCTLMLYKGLGLIYIATTENDENREEVRHLIPELIDRLPSLGNKHLDRADVQLVIARMYVFTANYTNCYEWAKIAIKSVSENRSERVSDKEQELRNDAFYHISLCNIRAGRITYAENELCKIHTDTSNNENNAKDILLYFDKVLLLCTIQCMKKNIHGICAHLDQVDQVLSRHAGIIKAVAGAGGYLNRMGHLAYYLIYILSVKKSGVTLNEIEKIVTKVLWVNEYGKTLQVLTAEDADRLCKIAQAMYFSSLLPDSRQEQAIQDEKRKQALYNKIQKIKKRFNLHSPPAIEFYDQAMVIAAAEEKIQCFTHAIAEAEKYMLMITQVRADTADATSQEADEIKQYQGIISHSIRKIRQIFQRQYGPAESMVRTFDSLRDSALSSLQSAGKTTFTALKRMAELSAEHEKLTYGIERDVTKRGC